MTRFRLLRPISARSMSGAVSASGGLTITAGSGSAYDSAAQDAYFDSLYSSAFAALTYSSTKYVSTSGSTAVARGHVPIRRRVCSIAIPLK